MGALLPPFACLCVRCALRSALRTLATFGMDAERQCSVRSLKPFLLAMRYGAIMHFRQSSCMLLLCCFPHPLLSLESVWLVSSLSGL